jgi:hypothetical protein
MKVGLLTTEQKELLLGVFLQPDWYFNTIQDIEDNWIISTLEIDSTTNNDFMWVKELPLIDWNPKPVSPLG